MKVYNGILIIANKGKAKKGEPKMKMTSKEKERYEKGKQEALISGIQELGFRVEGYGAYCNKCNKYYPINHYGWICKHSIQKHQYFGQN